MKGGWKIIHGDCIDEMRKMQDGSVDYVFTSPPYNDSGKTARDIEKRRHIKYMDSEYRDDWLEWQSECIDEMIRVAKKMVFYNVQPILSNKADVYRIIGNYANKIHMILIWYKPNAQPQPYSNRIGNSYEMVIIFKCKEFKNLHCNDEHYNNVIVQNINSNREYSDIHGAVMSQPFADEIIREFTQKGETILDPFSGLATTGVACVKQSRNYIGVELNEEYYKLSKTRLLDETSQLSWDI